MVTQLHNTGEEVMLRDFFEESVDKTNISGLTIGLFSDNTDGLTDADDVDSITTDPNGSAYARATLSFGTSQFTAESNANGNWQVVFSDMTFDTSDSSNSVDAYYVEINFQSQETGDTSKSPHLLFTGDLDQSYDLTQIDSFTLSGAGLEID